MNKRQAVEQGQEGKGDSKTSEKGDGDKIPLESIKDDKTNDIASMKAGANNKNNKENSVTVDGIDLS